MTYMTLFSRSLAATLALVILLIPRTAAAQEAQVVSFNDAVRIALQQNVSLKRTANSMEIDAIALQQARSSYLPNLNVSFSGSENYGRTFSQEQLAFINQSSNFLSARANSSITLFDGMSRVADNRQASYNLEASDFNYQRQQQAVVFNVMSQYLILLERRETIRIQEENLASQQQQLEQIQEFTNVGERPISDLYQQQAAVANAELAVLNAERAYQISEVNLIQVLQLDPFGQYEFVAPTVSDNDLVPEMYEIPTMLREAFGTRADLKASENAILAAEQGIAFARAGFMPSLSLSIGSGTNYTNQNTRFDFQEQFFDNNLSSSVGLSLNVPLFNRFGNRNAVERARVQYENARLNLQDLQQNIALDVRQAYLDYITAEKALDVTEKQEISAQQALTAAQERYNLGSATLVELSQAQAAYVQAESDRNQARYDFLFRKKLIDYYLGKLDPAETLFE